MGQSRHDDRDAALRPANLVGAAAAGAPAADVGTKPYVFIRASRETRLSLIPVGRFLAHVGVTAALPAPSMDQVEAELEMVRRRRAMMG